MPYVYIHRQNDKNAIVKSVTVNGVEVTEEKKISDNLNLHISTVSKGLANDFSTNNNTNYLKYLTKVKKEITTFDLIYETQITKLIERLPNKKSSELDNISNILVKRLFCTIRIL